MTDHPFDFCVCGHMRMGHEKGKWCRATCGCFFFDLASSFVPNNEGEQVNVIEGAHPDVPILKTGRLEAKADPRTVPFSALLKQVSTLKVPASKVRSTAIKTPLGMLGNDTYGDCEWADQAHQMMLWGWVEKDTTVQHFSDDEVVKAYLQYTGGQDTGTNMLDALNLRLRQPWANFQGKCIDAFAGISLGSQMIGDVQGSIYVTGGCSLGVALPLALQRTPYDWTAVPNKNDPMWQPGSWGGHAVVALDYDDKGVTIVSWGKLVKVTWTMLQWILQEAYAVMSPYWRNRKGNSPNGITAQHVRDWLAQHKAA